MGQNSIGVKPKYPWLLAALLVSVAACGCGTSKWTDTSRTAMEQLLISDTMDRAVSQMDLRALAGKPCFLMTHQSAA